MYQTDAMLADTLIQAARLIIIGGIAAALTHTVWRSLHRRQRAAKRVASK